ncbi:MAG: ribose 5-phosphate isomerase A [Gemmatimonadota bacterium]
MSSTVTLDSLKRDAAAEALRLVDSGMVLGLGTGSTVYHLVDLLGEALREGRLRDIVGVPTSVRTEQQALELGIPLAELGAHPELDMTIDGADEVAPNLDLIKGLGAALLREKMVAQASKRLVIISDDTKLVDRLGQKAPLPVEVVDWALDAQARFIEGLGASATLRLDANDSPVRSDNGNVFLDARFDDGIPDPSALERALLYRAGVVDTGLFLGMADTAVIASADGVSTMTRGGVG